MMLHNALNELKSIIAFLRSGLLWLLDVGSAVGEWLWFHPLATFGGLCACWAIIRCVNDNARRETDELMARIRRGEKLNFWDLW